MALGIVAFALLPLFALLPISMNIHRESIEATLTAQMVQCVLHDANQTEFESLTNGNANLGPYYFDNEGIQVDSATTARLFDVKVDVVYPATMPSSGTGLSRNLAKLEIQMVRNPGGSIPQPFNQVVEPLQRHLYVAKNDQF